ncbi:MAG: nucleotidyltransferase domain-containing protein [Planctomycetaceae bacterium]|jgi:type I restriction enzyme S subunit|nr:nucleotidyltransferase domain-containing protein [Planctomycetaceae bacterium]
MTLQNSMTIDGLTLEPVDLAMVLAILRRRIPDRTVWVFGSRANGKARKNSDLDLVIQGSEAIPNDLYNQLVEDFDESDLPIRVDLLDWNRIDNDFKPYINKNHVVLV